MKKILLLTIFLLSGIWSFSQTETLNIAKVTNMEIVGHVADGDTSFILLYRNAKYTSIVDFEYIIFENKEQVDIFFQNTKKVFSDEKDMTYDIGDGTVSKYNASTAFVSGKIGYCLVTMKQLLKLESIYLLYKFN